MEREAMIRTKDILNSDTAQNDLDEKDQSMDYFFQRIQNKVKEILKGEPYNIEHVEKFADYLFSEKHAKEIDMPELKKVFIDKPFHMHKQAYKNFKLINNIAHNIIKKYFNIINQNYFTKVSNSYELSESLQAQEQAEYAKEYSFLEFLKIISKNDNDFIPKNYLNRGKFNYLFITDIIHNIDGIIDYFEVKRYFKKGFEVISQIKDKKLGFYFSLLGNKCDYGFYDYGKDSVFKIGEFQITNIYIKKLVKFDCLKHFNNIIPNINVNNLVLLNKIKEEFVNYIKKGEVEILDSNRICKKIKISEIPYELSYENKHLIMFKNWIYRHKWYNRVYPIIAQENDELLFILKIK